MNGVANGDPRKVTSFDVQQRAESELIGPEREGTENRKKTLLVARVKLFTGEDITHADAEEYVLAHEDRERLIFDARLLVMDVKKLTEFLGSAMLEDDVYDAYLILAACHGNYQSAKMFLLKEAGMDLSAPKEKIIERKDVDINAIPVA